MRIAVAATGTFAEILADRVSPVGLAVKADVESLRAACPEIVCESVVPDCSPPALNKLSVTVLLVAAGFTMTISVFVV